MRRFRDPGSDQQREGGGHDADQEQAAPADGVGGECGEGGGDHDAERDEDGDEAADEAPHAGRDEFLHQWQVDAVQAADAEADEEAEDRQEPPAVFRREGEDAAGEGEVDDGADEDLAAAVNVGEAAPDDGAQDGAYAGRQQDDGGLAEGQVPGLDDEGEHEADQVIVEEFEHVADDRGGDDLDLVGR